MSKEFLAKGTMTVADATVGTTKYSNSILINIADSVAIHAAFTGAGITGSIFLQGSVDDTTFETLTSSTVAIAAAGSQLFTYNSPAFNYMRVGVTSTVGTIVTVLKFNARGE